MKTSEETAELLRQKFAEIEKILLENNNLIYKIDVQVRECDFDEDMHPTNDNYVYGDEFGNAWEHSWC